MLYKLSCCLMLALRTFRLFGRSLTAELIEATMSCESCFRLRSRIYLNLPIATSNIQGGELLGGTRISSMRGEDIRPFCLQCLGDNSPCKKYHFHLSLVPELWDWPMH